MSDQIAIDNYKLYIATNSADEVADLLVNQDKVIAGLTKNNSDFAKKYRELTADLARLRELLGEVKNELMATYVELADIIKENNYHPETVLNHIQQITYRIQSELKE